LTEIGVATVSLLNMNDPDTLQVTMILVAWWGFNA
jgi:hypothetical protein